MQDSLKTTIVPKKKNVGKHKEATKTMDFSTQMSKMVALFKASHDLSNFFYMQCLKHRNNIQISKEQNNVIKDQNKH